MGVVSKNAAAPSAAVTAPTMAPGDWGGLLLLSLLRGGSFYFYKVLGEVLPALTIVFARVAIAAATLHLLLAMRGRRLPGEARIWRDFAVMGLLNNLLPFGLIVFGETRVSSGLASILNATMPMFTIVVAHGLTQSEKLSPSKVAGILAGFFGVVILVGPDARRRSGDLLGEAACLAAALIYAFASIFGRRFRGTDPRLVATGQLSASAVLLGVVFLHETLAPQVVVGMVSIGAGLVILDGRLTRLALGRPSRRAA